MKNLFSFFFLLTSTLVFTQTNDSLTNELYEKFVSQFSLKQNAFYELKGKQLPSFELTLLNGEKILSSSLQGKPTVINFWFTACAPCIKEMPSLNELKEKFGNKVNFIAITYENEEEVSSFLERKKFDYIHIINANNYCREKIGLMSYPKTLILDKELKIVQVEERPIDKPVNEEQKMIRLKTWIDTTLNKLL